MLIYKHIDLLHIDLYLVAQLQLVKETLNYHFPTDVVEGIRISIKNDGFCIKTDGFRIQNDGFCIKNDGFRIQNDEFCIKNDELWKAPARATPAPTDWNEADYFEPNWQRSFWGTNYPKLLEVKKKYDPEVILYPKAMGFCTQNDGFRTEMMNVCTN